MVPLTCNNAMQWGSQAVCTLQQLPQKTNNHHTRYPTDCYGRPQLDLHSGHFHSPGERQVLQYNESEVTKVGCVDCSCLHTFQNIYHTR